jgi:rRNA-processing protein FCF1
MPKIRTYTVTYTVSPNRHSMDVNIMYDTGAKVFYVAIPNSFKNAINTLPAESKEKWNINNAIALRGVNGLAIIHKNESELIEGLEDLFYYCGNAIKQVRNVIIVTSDSKSNSDSKEWDNMGCNIERFKLKQEFSFVLAIETKVGEGKPIYTYQGVTYTNTISTYSGTHGGRSIIIDDTPENRAFLEDVYSKFDSLIVNLKKFFESSDTILELIASNQKLLN